MRANSPLRHTAIALLTAAAAACTNEPVTGPGSPAAARHAVTEPSLQDRPVHGRCDLTFSAPPSPPSPIFTQTDEGSCIISGLGRTAYTGVQTINLISGTQAGTRTLTAANGDMLFLSHVGTSSMTAPGQVSFVATLTVTGGTGRFAGATGTLTGRGVAMLAARTTTVELEGRVRYAPAR